MGFNKKGNYRREKDRRISITVYGENGDIIFSKKDAPLKTGTEDLVGFICRKLEGWDFLANMVFRFLGGG